MTPTFRSRNEFSYCNKSIQTLKLLINMNDKVCLTTFVYGEKYQNYLPMLLYSSCKANPNYDVILFLYDNLKSEIKNLIDQLELTNKLIIFENCFKDCPRINSLKSQCLRWVLWNDIFKEYDYLYTIDVDMFYIKEPTPLHIQHIQHMQTTGLPFDNMRRICYPQKNCISILRRIKYAGLRSIIKFIKENNPEYKLTGLHFVDVENYYRIFTHEKREIVKKEIYNNGYLEYIMTVSDEVLLATIMKKIGFDINNLAIQSNSISSLSFENPTRPEFRPHHGIHMGIFRNNIDTINKNKGDKDILDSETYAYYINIFKNEILPDPNFKLIIDNCDNNIKDSFKNLFEYYKINENSLSD